MRRNFINALMREISQTSIYRVCCYKVICLRNRANPIGSRAFRHTADTNDLKKKKKVFEEGNSEDFSVFNFCLIVFRFREIAFANRHTTEDCDKIKQLL